MTILLRIVNPKASGIASWKAFSVIVLSLLGIGTMPALAAAPQITSFAPASGPMATSVTLHGTGFTGATSVKVGGVACVFKVTSATAITATIPVIAITGQMTVVVAGLTGTSTTNFTVTPGAFVSYATGRPLVTLDVYGGGFHPSDAVDVYFDTTDLALTVTTSTGLIQMPLQVPAGAQPGAHYITLVERGTYAAAQKPFSVITNWAMQGFAQTNDGLNPYENTLTTSNVSNLTATWSKPVSEFGNQAPLIEFGGVLYAGEVEGTIHAYSATGTLLWTASPGSSLSYSTPVGYGSSVFFADANGNVYAYNALCRKDGGVCSPLWTTSVGTSVQGGLTELNGSIYAPSSDGMVHPLNPTTGVQGTPFYAYGDTFGPITTSVAFSSIGGYFYGAGSDLLSNFGTGDSGYAPVGSTVSAAAVYDGTAYATAANGSLYQSVGFGWTSPTSGTGCAPAPAIAYNMVFAAGCSTIAAYDPSSGKTLWSIATASAVSALSVANGVLYACEGSNIAAYAASDGGKLWNGGGCTGAPVVVNGTVYAVEGELTAYNIAGSMGNNAARPIDPRQLVPDHRLKPTQSHIAALQ